MEKAEEEPLPCSEFKLSLVVPSCTWAGAVSRGEAHHVICAVRVPNVPFGSWRIETRLEKLLVTADTPQ